MNRKQWLATRDNGGSLQSFLRSREVLVHKSADACMIPNPVDPMGPRIPWQSKPGRTYSVGRNQAKRDIRTGARKIWRVLPHA